MSVKFEDPVIVDSPYRKGETIETHPAYGQIRCSRHTGSSALYGSDFVHHHYMTVSIARSETTRTLSTDWPHAKMPDLIEVAMSESQWAAFISTPNSGMGTRCTIREFDGKVVPWLPEPTNRGEQFRAEMHETVKRAQREVQELRVLVQELRMDGKLTDRVRKQLEDKLHQADMAVTSSIDFVAKMFGEHVEKVTDQAKTEVEAYIEARIRSAGLEALGVGQLLELPEGSPQDVEAPAIDIVSES